MSSWWVWYIQINSKVLFITIEQRCTTQPYQHDLDSFLRHIVDVTLHIWEYSQSRYAWYNLNDDHWLPRSGLVNLNTQHILVCPEVGTKVPFPSPCFIAVVGLGARGTGARVHDMKLCPKSKRQSLHISFNTMNNSWHTSGLCIKFQLFVYPDLYSIQLICFYNRHYINKLDYCPDFVVTV